MHSRSSYLAAALLLAGTSLSVAPARAAEAQDILVTTPLKVEKFIPLAEINQHPEIRVVMPEAVDPLAIYSDITTFTGQAFAQGAATGGITRMVMDDVTFTTDPAVGGVTVMRFSVANLNAGTISVRPRVRFWNADGAPLGAGLPNGPGTYYAPGGVAQGFTFNAIAFGAGVTTVTSAPLATPMPIPAGTTTTLWAGITFDNNAGATGATDADLSNFGQGMFTPVDLGSSTNTLFETTAAGSFFNTNNPPGAALNFGGSPVANQGWELVVTTLPVELSGFSVE